MTKHELEAVLGPIGNDYHFEYGFIDTDGTIYTEKWIEQKKVPGHRVVYTGQIKDLPLESKGIVSRPDNTYELNYKKFKVKGNKIVKSEVDVLVLNKLFDMEFRIQKEAYATGAVREDAGDAPRPDLIPPEFILRLAKHYALGSKKYAERNWEKGIPIMRTYASMLRHLLKWAVGHTDEDHLIAVVWNAIAIMFTLERIKEGTLPESLDDRPNHMKEKK